MTETEWSVSGCWCFERVSGESVVSGTSMSYCVIC